MPGQDRSRELECLLESVCALRARVVEEARRWMAEAVDDPAAAGAAAWNLAHYLAFRRQDLRELQGALARRGLSSLGRSEAHVMATLDALVETLAAATGRPRPILEAAGPRADFDTGATALAANAAQLFGCEPERGVRIMVTLPAAAADDPGLVGELLAAGMDCARINCAHDDADAWERMIRHLRAQQAEQGRCCRVLMDLAGHKVRTGPLAARSAVIHLKPGKASGDALVEFSAETGESAVLGKGRRRRYRLAVEPAVIERLAPGMRLSFVDARGRRHSLAVTERGEGRAWQARLTEPAYVSETTRFEYPGDAGGFVPRGLGRQPVAVRVFEGDALLLTGDGRPGGPARLDEQGAVVEPAHVPCTAPEVLARLEPGAPVWIDDGKIGARVEGRRGGDVLLRVIHAGPEGRRIKPDKGLNFPETPLDLPALSDKDRRDLDFVARHADMVGFSFVETAADMRALMAELAARGAAELAIVAKVENRRAVEHLPEIVLAALDRHPLGIMIARGDLAVEVGPEALVEVQESLLWLAEAAHVPVIWATQVLETLAKKGAISRPELTDAAMAERAECVMLNKGPYIVRAVTTLADILQRMQAHQRKKSPRLGPLQRLAG